MQKNKIKQLNPLLIPYVTAGFPSKKLFLPILNILSKSSADFIEVGVPFSDPLADGPVIQDASKKAIKNGVSLKWIISILKKENIKKFKPLILFSYLNPILNYGFEKLLKDLPKKHFYGLIIPDLPLDEAKRYLKFFKKHKLNLILLAAPNSNKSKLKEIAKYSNGFIYLVSLTGTTGIRKNIPGELKQKISEIKSFTNKPVAVGFGISNLSQAKKVISYGADGVIVGSALIKQLTENSSNHVLLKLNKFIGSFNKIKN